PGLPTPRACAPWPRPDLRLLAIETSCDETAAAVVEDDRRLLSNVISSQAALHPAYGGVVPEVAARHHLENICPVIEKAMADAGTTLPELAARGVAQGTRRRGGR